MKPRKYTLHKFDSGMHYIMPDEATIRPFLKNGNKRVLCTAGDVTFHCAVMHKKEGGYYINIGSAICKKLGIKKGDSIQVRFTADETEYQFDIPVEFKEVLATDPMAADVFAALTDGNKRGLIYLVTLVKSTDKRIERALQIATAIKNGVTSPRLVLKKGK